jgi:predicted MPP superfamily phosphohydrolase
MIPMNARRLVVALTLALGWPTIGREFAAARGQQGAQTPGPVQLPNKVGSLKFAAFGDFGNGNAAEYQTAAQLIKTYAGFRFDLVTTIGDNLLGSESPQDFRDKFEIPYKPLLDSGVKFYAALGNHDLRDERDYKPFNMNGRLYYSFKAPNQDVRFFVLESGDMSPDEVKWIDNELRASTEQWKIVYFHVPVYSSSATHGSNLALRATLEPMFIKYGVSVVLSGHDHVYERTRPQHGITYFVVGSGGELRRGDLRRTSLTAVGFDADNAFLIAEIIDDSMYFNAISRTGKIVDSGIITVRKAP